MTSDDIWKSYIRYIGAGAVATAGILTVLRGLPAMLAAFVAVVTRNARRAGLRQPRVATPRTDRDLPGCSSSPRSHV